MDSLGILEYKTVSAGIRAADLMAKTAAIRFIKAAVLCPGKYIIIFSAELSAIKAAVGAVTGRYPDGIIDCVIIGSPHNSLLGALTDTDRPDEIGALGILETSTAASAILAGDTCVKAAIVRLIEVRISRGMCGKSYVMFTGSIANVEEAISIALRNIDEENFVDCAVIPKPDENLWETIGEC